MCVQPMKSIAAVALTDVAAVASGSTATGLDAQSVTTAGILTGGAVLLLGVTNLMELVNFIVPSHCKLAWACALHPKGYEISHS